MRACLVTVAIIVTVVQCQGTVSKIIPYNGSLDGSFESMDAPVVNISDGGIVGSRHITVDKHVPYEAYRGIPFAKPPVGDLRFANPEKNDRWNGYWDATEDAEVCVQGSGDNIVGSEDCLYVNVYAPKGARNKAVMVWIYGGAFTGGSSTYQRYGPDYFLEDDVVFVSFNYRLGIFGFLSTGDKRAPGNWALKDQVLALQWVRENIVHFGGDPNKITIFGESAGGASVSYLLQIPQAEGLFDAAIIQSGTSLNLWSQSTRARQSAFQVGLNLGIPTITANALVRRLRNVDAIRLQSAAASVLAQVYIVNPLRGLPWAPVVEPDVPGAVFTSNSDELLRTGSYANRVPTMIGYTSNEAGHAHGLPEHLRAYLVLYDVTPNNLVPFSLTSSSIKRALAAIRLRKHFFKTGSLTRQFNETVRFINSDQFTRGAIRMAESMSQYAPVYFYVFGYEGAITGEQPYTGVGHAEELAYLFRHDTTHQVPEDFEVRAKLVRLWTNFAKTFNPTPTSEPLLDNVIWPKVKPGSGGVDYVWLNYTISPDVNPSEADYSFYKDLFDRYGSPPFTTY